MDDRLRRVARRIWRRRRGWLAAIGAAAVLTAAAPAPLPPFDEAKSQALLNVDPAAARAAAAPYVAAGAKVPPKSVAAALRVTALSHAVQGHYGVARDYFERAYVLAEQAGDLFYMAGARINIATTWHQQGDYARAIDSYRQGSVIAARAKHYRFHGNALANLSEVMATLGDPANAIALSRQAELLYQRAGEALPPAGFVQRASYALAMGNAKAAIADLDRASALLAPDDAIYGGDLQRYRAEAFAQAGRPAEARAPLQRCFALARKAELPSTLLGCEEAAAQLAIAEKRPADARSAIARMDDLHRKIGQTGPAGDNVFGRDMAMLRLNLARLEKNEAEIARQLALATDFERRILNYRQKIELAAGALEMERQGKDLSIDLLEQRNANMALRNQQQLLFWSGGFVVVLLVLGGGFWWYRARQAVLRREQRLDERTRIARDLHDTLLQEMTGTQLALSAATQQARKEGSTLAPTLDAMTRQIGHAMVSARNTVWRMRNEDVSRGDLAGAVVAWIAQAHADHQDMIFLDVDQAPEHMESEKAEHLLRIIQEAVGNALRHGNPSRVEVTIKAVHGRLDVRVVDDGIGFAISEMAERQGAHWGLVGLRERADRIGAMLKIESAPGQGTRLMVSVS